MPENKESMLENRNYSKKEYWLISPDNVEYKGINIPEFAKSQNLCVPSLYELVAGTINSHHGWRRFENADYHRHRSYEGQVINLKEEIFGPISDVRKFMEEHSLSDRFYDLINGKTKYYDGWRLLENREVQKYKTYDIQIISPTGEIYGPIENLSEFARIHNLHVPALIGLINKEYKSHKDWKLLENKDYKPGPKEYNVTLLNKETGEKVGPISNLQQFCNEKGLDISNLFMVIKKKRNSHKN